MSRSLVLTNSELIEKSVANNESELTHTGALLSLTGNRTGRSPKDRFIVEESSTKDKIDWGEVNRQFEANHFDKLWDKVNNYLDDRDNYVSNVHVGSNKDHYIPVEVKSELGRLCTTSDRLGTSLNLLDKVFVLGLCELTSLIGIKVNVVSPDLGTEVGKTSHSGIR